MLVVPALLALHRGVAWEQIALFVGAFGATGHHLPGMLRAYGDRGLFRQFRVRFIVAPVALVAATIYSSIEGLGGIFLVAYAWGIWHAIMQTYGMARIYDAKVAAFSPLTSRLDWLLCVGWFGAGTLLSPVRMGKLLAVFYEAGGFVIEAQWLSWLRVAWMAGTLAVSVAYVYHLVLLQRAGQRPSWIKLLLLFSSCAFWWITTVTVRHMLVGIALWEICHDIQYLTIVWVFNRSRAQKDPGVGAFTRFVFGRSPALAGAYVGLVLGYGSLAWVGVQDHGAGINHVLEGLLVASGLLHFYYDGFIWKIRDRSVGASLALRQDASQSNWHNVTWPRHLAAWAMLAVPVLLLAAAQRARAPSEFDRLSAVIAAVPDYSDAYDKRGLALVREGHFDAAARDFEMAIEQQPDHAKAKVNRLLLRARGQEPSARIALYREALALRPGDPRTQQLIANALRIRGDSEAATRHYQRALAIKPDHHTAHFGLAKVLVAQGALPEAIEHYEAGLDAKPEDVRARTELALLFIRRNEWEAAQQQLELALEQAPEDPRVQAALARVRTRY